MYGFYLFNVFYFCNPPPPHGGCAGGTIGTRFPRPRGTSPLKEGPVLGDCHPLRTLKNPV